MRLVGHLTRREEAQELAWQALEPMEEGEAQSLCRKALDIYPDCVEARAILAELESETDGGLIARLRQVVEAGRRDLGPAYVKEKKGHFWDLHETRPFMRALDALACVLMALGTPEAVEEAMEIHEEMLTLNPNDNQSVRDWLSGTCLACKGYEDAAALLARYPDDWIAAAAWARVLLAYVTEGAERASELLVAARERNEHVEKYLTGQKRRPRGGPYLYSYVDENEAACCADALWEAWKKHRKAKRWLREECSTSG